MNHGAGQDHFGEVSMIAVATLAGQGRYREISKINGVGLAHKAATDILLFSTLQLQPTKAATYIFRRSTLQCQLFEAANEAFSWSTLTLQPVKFIQNRRIGTAMSGICVYCTYRSAGRLR